MRSALLSLALCLTASAAAAQTVIVPDDFATIQAAIDASSAGRILVRPGTYTENLNFQGKPLRVVSEFGADATRIDGGANGDVVRFVNGETNTSILEGFTVANGGPSSNGGGVRVVASAPLVRDCILRNNAANRGAGAHLVNAAGASFVRCRFVDGASVQPGGGAYVRTSTITFTDCEFQGNSSNQDGGGLYLEDCTASVTRCSFVENSAVDEGAGLCIVRGDTTVERCTFVRNNAVLGGGVRVRDAVTAALAGCMFSANDALGWGGGLNAIGCTPTLDSCTLGRNVAGVAGGGLSADAATLTLENTIVWGNSPAGIELLNGGTSLASFCDVEGGHPGSGNIDTDPGFAAIGDNLRLDAGSACIDTGNAAAAGLPAVDYDGGARNVGAGVDMGADEFDAAPSAAFLDKLDPDDVRLMTYNVLFNTIFPSVNATQAAKFERVVQALDPDVINLQEISSFGPGQVASLLNGIRPLPSGSWQVYRGYNNIIASKYPFSQGRSTLIPGGQRALAMALIDLPAPFENDLYVINNHSRCCGGNDPERQEQADAIASWVHDALTPGDFIDLPVGTGMAIVGDLNAVDGFQHVTTLINGDVQDEATYGGDGLLDWDGSANTDARPAHNGGEPLDYTWRDDGSGFPPGQLDFVIYTDSVLDVARSFVLNTTLMSPGALAAAGLQAFDVTQDAAGTDFDHLPVVVDFRPAAATLAGTQEDLVITSAISGAGPPSFPFKQTVTGDTVEVTLDSPGGTFDGELSWMMAEVFFPEQRPLGGNVFPYVHISSAGLIFLWGPEALPVAGRPLSFPVPPVVMGVSVRFQGLVVAQGISANGLFSTSSAIDVHFR